MSKINDSYRHFKRIRKIGENTITLPEPPPIKEIANYDLPEKEQKFKPSKLPVDWDYMSSEEATKFEEQELQRCNDGFWFFNNGNLEYITGHHYFYITWFKIKIEDSAGVQSLGLPSFTDTDRDFYYLWDFVENNPNVGGIVYITKRRSGKTYRAAEIVFTRSRWYRDLKAGIQSKNEGDAYDVVQMIIDAMEEMPPFLVPKFDGQLSKSRGIYFNPPNLKNTKISHKDRKKDKSYMYSSIRAKATTHNAFDSGNLGFYLCDEAGKWDKVDVNSALAVVLKTMVSGASITGKCIVTSTVEEMEKKGGKELKKIWDKADPSKLTSYGRTTNTLIRYFEPAYRGFRGEANGQVFIDEYGYSKDEAAKHFLNEARKPLTGTDLLEEKRMNPFVIEDAFQILSKDSDFDTEKIKANLRYNETHVNSDNLIRGNFRWTSSIETPDVYFEPNSDGNFYVKWMPNPEDRNNYTIKHTPDGVQRFPTTNSCVIGSDPFDNKTTTENKRSDGAIHVYRKFNPLYPDDSDCFVAEYIHRPDAPEHFWEDVLKACVFYGCEVLCETNKMGLTNHARMNGYYGYLMERPEATHTAYSKKRTVERGISMSGEKPRDYLINKVRSYVFNHLGYDENGDIKTFMPFSRTLKDWGAFESNNWTDYDATVSSGLALIAAEGKKIKTESKVRQPLLPKFNNNGLVSNRR